MLVLLFLFGCGSQSADDQTREVRPQPAAAVAEAVPEFAEFEVEARASTNRLQLELKQELSAAMKDGGAASAVEVCSQRAAALTAEVSQRTGLDVRRVSLQNRNPDNQAAPVEASVLAMMAVHTDLTDTMIVRDGAPLYMRAIRINAPVCLSCHGAKEDLDPEVLSKLDALYADDKATGFSEGDLRGAFVVKPLPQ
jgi:hypothetical protein